MAIDSGTTETPAPGVVRGATDFSEFTEGSGVPAGITLYGDDVLTTSIASIASDPVEGNHFRLAANSRIANGRAGFGYDAFDGLMAQGELLLRIWAERDVSLNRKMGGAMGMDAADIRRLGFFSMENAGDFKSEIAVLGGADIQEPEQNLVWAWMRLRHLENPSIPGFFVSSIKTWYGDLEDEPASFDFVSGNINVSIGARAIGWGVSNSAFFTVDLGLTKVAFFSFSTADIEEDLETFPPPVPSEVGEDVDPWTPVEDEATAWAACGEVVTEPEPALELTSTGLVFRDQFDRADSNDLGNGWEEDEGVAGDIEIVSGAVNITSGEALRPTDEVGETDDVIAQANFENVAEVFWFLAMRADDVGQERYRLIGDSRTGSKRWLLNRVLGGGSSTIASSTSGDVPDVGEIWSVRGVIEGTIVRLMLAKLAALGDIDVDFTERLSVDDSGASFLNTFNRTGFSANAEMNIDEFFVCGIGITVSGLPTGWKAQVDGRAAVAEAGGVATLDPTTWALPAGTIRVLDDGDVEQITLTPAAGIWGGDSYEFSMVAGSGGIVTDWSGKADEATAWVECEA